MMKLRNHLIGVEDGTVILFSHFEDGGPMWSGKGPRMVSRAVRFSEPFRAPPTVFVSVGMWDIDQQSNQRGDLTARITTSYDTGGMTADSITPDGFNIVFRTWGDTQVARIRASWMAMGELAHADDWDID